MSLESFIGFDAGEGMSEAAFEAFKEKMKAAAAQIAAIKKEEGKQKKKEEELHKILLKFIQNSGKKDLTLLISRALEQNIPANFILAMIMLGNEDIQREVGQFIMLMGEQGAQGEQGEALKQAPQNSHALTFFDEEDKTTPMKVKIEVDAWIKNMLFQAEETPHKLMRNAYDMQMIEDKEKKEIKGILIQLSTFIMRDFLEQNKIDESYTKLAEFARFIISGILNKVQEILDNTKMIGGEISPSP